MHSKLNLVPLADVQCLPDRIRQGELRLLAKLCSSVGLRTWFSLCTSLVQTMPPGSGLLGKSNFPNQYWPKTGMSCRFMDCPDNLGQQSSTGSSCVGRGTPTNLLEIKLL
jgi:hypothetical protein